jgi:hypothetical protein
VRQETAANTALPYAKPSVWCFSSVYMGIGLRYLRERYSRCQGSQGYGAGFQHCFSVRLIFLLDNISPSFFFIWEKCF